MHCISTCRAHFGNQCNPTAKGCALYSPGPVDHTYGTGVDTRKSGDELISEERIEQVIKHGRTVLYDIAHNGNSELIDMAGMLILDCLEHAPNSWAKNIKNKMFAKTQVQRLVIAGALIAAEIDRLNLQAKILADQNKTE